MQVKKSEMYRMLQMTLITDEAQFDYGEKLEALRELMIQEDLAKYEEEQEAKKNEGVQ